MEKFARAMTGDKNFALVSAGWIITTTSGEKKI